MLLPSLPSIWHSMTTSGRLSSPPWKARWAMPRARTVSKTDAMAALSSAQQKLLASSVWRRRVSSGPSSRTSEGSIASSSSNTTSPPSSSGGCLSSSLRYSSEQPRSGTWTGDSPSSKAGVDARRCFQKAHVRLLGTGCGGSCRFICAVSSGEYVMRIHVLLNRAQRESRARAQQKRHVTVRRMEWRTGRNVLASLWLDPRARSATTPC
mmetsp:Transcript_152869/g.267126  ORF Transcript_152869/g.267126 Transcript_152869/m.267126 type:complete len:209 (+) Transcript_152869:718-1344(+)